MKKMKMCIGNYITFEEGCNKYLIDCKQRNLREGTINHYKQSYLQFYKYFDPDMPITDFNKDMYNNYVLFLKNKLNNDVSINSYLRDLITTLHFFMNEGYIQPFQMKSIKVDKNIVETYTENELKILLKKPNIKKCTYAEYQCWVITNFLFSTGVRQRSLINIQIKDLDLDNNIVNIRVTKNRKPLVIPINQTLVGILSEFLKYRQYKTKDDFLFCTVYGNQMTKSGCYGILYNYNKRRGVETTGVHRYRHTFAKQWILNGGDVVTLSRLLGHSTLNITQNYINLLVSELSEKVGEIDLLNKFCIKKSIKIN